MLYSSWVLVKRRYFLWLVFMAGCVWNSISKWNTTNSKGRHVCCWGGFLVLCEHVSYFHLAENIKLRVIGKHYFTVLKVHRTWIRINKPVLVKSVRCIMVKFQFVTAESMLTMSKIKKRFRKYPNLDPSFLRLEYKDNFDAWKNQYKNVFHRSYFEPIIN